MKQIKALEINRTIAEILEPKLEWPCTDNGWRQSQLTCWTGHFGSNRGLEYVEPLDFAHDPRGTVMLIKELRGRRIHINIYSIDVYDSTGDILASDSLGYAVARAFLRAHGITVGEDK